MLLWVAEASINGLFARVSSGRQKDWIFSCYRPSFDLKFGSFGGLERGFLRVRALRAEARRKLPDPCMDGREAMSMSGPSYYMQRGMGAAGPGAQPGLRGPSPVIRSMPNPGASLAMQSSVSFGHGFHVESPPPPPPPPPPPTAHEVGAGAAAGEPVKRKRGRPRKYGPDGSVSLGLSPMSASAPQGVLMGSGSVSASAGPSQRRGRGRPPGTGRKQQLALLGELVN